MPETPPGLWSWKARWDRYWFAAVSPYPIAAFRILFGLYLLAYLASFAPHVELFFSNEGVYVPFLLPDYAPPPAVAYATYGLTVASAVLFVVGYRTRVVTPWLLVLYVYHYFLNFAGTNYSFDRINIILLVILCFAEADTVWAMRTVRAGEPVCAWATRLIRLEMAIMYFGSGLCKLLNPQWRDGHMIEMTYQGNWGTPLSFWLIQQHLPGWVYQGATWGVIGFELAIGFALFNRRSQKHAMVLGVLFHLANWVLLNIPEFMSCVASYVLFLPGDEVRSSGDGLVRGCARVIRRARPMRLAQPR